MDSIRSKGDGERRYARVEEALGTSPSMKTAERDRESRLFQTCLGKLLVIIRGSVGRNEGVQRVVENELNVPNNYLICRAETLLSTKTQKNLSVCDNLGAYSACLYHLSNS